MEQAESESCKEGYYALVATAFVKKFSSNYPQRFFKLSFFSELSEEEINVIIENNDDSKVVDLIKTLNLDQLLMIDFLENLNTGLFNIAVADCSTEGEKVEKLKIFFSSDRFKDSSFSYRNFQEDNSCYFGPNNRENKSFSIHSIGKVLTGALIIKMVQDGIIPEDDLTKPVELDEDVLSGLPEKLQEHLKQVTLHDLITHKGALGEFIFKYEKAAEEINQNCEIDQNDPKFLLEYIDHEGSDPTKIGEHKYSSTGFLFAALSAVHHYNKEKTPNERKNYSEILNEFVTDPAQMEISVKMPAGAMYAGSHKYAEHMSGNPDGGYWTTAEDLVKFGSCLCKQYKDSEFEKLLEEYGEEFYNKDTKIISHSGFIPGNAVYFSVNLKTEELIVGEGNSDVGIGSYCINLAESMKKAQTEISNPAAANKSKDEKNIM